MAPASWCIGGRSDCCVPTFHSITTRSRAARRERLPVAAECEVGQLGFVSAQRRSDGHAPRDIPQTERVIRHAARGDVAVQGDGPAACRLRRARRASLHHAAGHVPDDHSVLRGADQATVIRRECQRRRGGAVAGELLQRRPGQRPRGRLPSALSGAIDLPSEVSATPSTL